MAYATSADVAARLGRDLTESETGIVDARLADVELMIRNRVEDLDERVSLGKTSRDVVVMVEAEAVLRLIRNPDGYRQETDGNYSYVLSEAVASGRLIILDHEWVLLGARVGVASIAPKIRVAQAGRCEPRVEHNRFVCGCPGYPFSPCRELAQ